MANGQYGPPTKVDYLNKYLKEKSYGNTNTGSVFNTGSTASEIASASNPYDSAGLASSLSFNPMPGTNQAIADSSAMANYMKGPTNNNLTELQGLQNDTFAGGPTNASANLVNNGVGYPYKDTSTPNYMTPSELATGQSDYDAMFSEMNAAPTKITGGDLSNRGGYTEAEWDTFSDADKNSVLGKEDGTNWGMDGWGGVALGGGQLALGLANYLDAADTSKAQRRLLDQQYNSNASELKHTQDARKALSEGLGQVKLRK